MGCLARHDVGHLLCVALAEQGPLHAEAPGDRGLSIAVSKSFPNSFAIKGDWKKFTASNMQGF